MQGLDLSRKYYQKYGPVFLSSISPSIKSRIAIGLVGEGSECLGFDDGLSMDHDFGPGFCVWVPRNIYTQWSSELKTSYERLPKSFMGFERRETKLAGRRMGIFEVENFCKTLTGLEHSPQSLEEWLRIPEQLLALLTDGEVFYDPTGYFSSIREAYTNFYPEQVLRKKISADMASMSQSGQYNFTRCLKRDAVVAANTARSEFVQSTMAALHLLTKTYMPFYKWSFRSLVERAHVPLPICVLLRKIASASIYDVKEDQINFLCKVILNSVSALGWVSTDSDFLLDAAVEIWQNLDSDSLRSCPLGEGMFH
ncbi:MAG: DUF4037 domain-containing protein [Olegusella sp.]|nr:DUF4037 domain-containing protein [Olegusella sp.]